MTADEILAKLDLIKADIKAWGDQFDKRLNEHTDQVKADIKAWSDQFDKRLNEQGQQIADLEKRITAVENKVNKSDGRR